MLFFQCPPHQDQSQNNFEKSSSCIVQTYYVGCPGWPFFKTVVSPKKLEWTFLSLVF
jgi:hypothetical protein